MLKLGALLLVDHGQAALIERIVYGQIVLELALQLHPLLRRILTRVDRYRANL